MKAMDKGVADMLKKRKPDDADKDEGPPAELDQGLKRKKTRKDTEPSKKTTVGDSGIEAGDTQVATGTWRKTWISDLTQDILVGPAYKLLKGTCRNYVELEYSMEECYKALNDQLYWNNPEGAIRDIGSPGVDGPPIMPEDPYAYIMAAYEVPPSPDYIHGPEEQTFHAATSPTAESQGIHSRVVIQRRISERGCRFVLPPLVVRVGESSAAGAARAGIDLTISRDDHTPYDGGILLLICRYGVMSLPRIFDDYSDAQMVELQEAALATPAKRSYGTACVSEHSTPGEGTEGVLNLLRVPCQGKALTWLEPHVKTTTPECCRHAMTWRTSEKLMTAKYCPRARSTRDVKKSERSGCFRMENLDKREKLLDGCPTRSTWLEYVGRLSPEILQDCAIEFALNLMEEIDNIGKRKHNQNQSENPMIGGHNRLEELYLAAGYGDRGKRIRSPPNVNTGLIRGLVFECGAQGHFYRRSCPKLKSTTTTRVIGWKCAECSGRKVRIAVGKLAGSNGHQCRRFVYLADKRALGNDITPTADVGLSPVDGRSEEEAVLRLHSGLSIQSLWNFKRHVVADAALRQEGTREATKGRRALVMYMGLRSRNKPQNLEKRLLKH
ncbi:hypothetical protein Tco_1391882 [Tanacetum coccineum]